MSGTAPAGVSKATLHVLHVISSMAPEAGGPPGVCAGLAGALAAKGHAVTVATIENPGQSHISISSAVTLQAFPGDGSPRYARSTALGAWLAANVRQFDIVHLHSVWQYPTFAAARACWPAQKPYVVLLNGMLDRYVVEQKSRWVKRAYWLWRESKIESRANAVHFLNHAEIRRAVSWISQMPKFVIGNGVSRSEVDALPARGQFRARHPEIADRPLALFLSRLHPKKGLDRLIPAWRALAASRPELRLVIAGAGDPDYVAAIDRLIVANGLQENILRVGQLVGEQKWQALVDADVFVLPSHQEGFSMAITEALAAACPVVITEECNFDEVGKQQCGTIIRNGDMDAFTKAVEILLDDPAMRTRYGIAGAAMVRNKYTWDKIADDLEHVYRHALAGRPFSADGADVWR